MDSEWVEIPSDADLSKIKSCISQFLRTNEIPIGFGVISVWESAIANKYLKSNTPLGSYCIIHKRRDGYTQPSIIKHAEDIWNADLYPIEIVRSSGCLFYALLKERVFSKAIADIPLLVAEEELPIKNAFYH